MLCGECSEHALVAAVEAWQLHTSGEQGTSFPPQCLQAVAFQGRKDHGRGTCGVHQG